MRRIGTLLFVLGTLCPAFGAMSVCELFKDLAAYDGQRVEVRGEVINGPRIMFLGAETCEHEFRAGLLTWPTAINLLPARTRDPAMLDLAIAIDEGWKAGKRPRAMATITGYLRLPSQARLRQWNGFGPKRKCDTVRAPALRGPNSKKPCTSWSVFSPIILIEFLLAPIVPSAAKP